MMVRAGFKVRQWLMSSAGNGILPIPSFILTKDRNTFDCTNHSWCTNCFTDILVLRMKMNCSKPGFTVFIKYSCL